MKRQATLWQLCFWAYHQQRAHVYLKTPYQWFQWAMAQSGTEPDGPRPQVHHDAAILHDAVISLDHRDADAIVWHAVLGAPPDMPEAGREPQPYPLDTDRADDYGRAQIGGRMVDYAVRVIDRISTVKPIYRRYGRKGLKQVGTETVTEDVRYCPIVWEPDPLFVGAVLGIYRGWASAMGRLHALIGQSDLREFEIHGEPPIVPAAALGELLFDSWREGKGGAEPIEATLPKIFPPYAVSLTEDGMELHHRITRSVVQRGAP